MKNLIKIGAICFLVLFMLTGCTKEGPYIPSYVSKGLGNNKGLVQDKKILIKKHNDYILSKKPTTFKGRGISIEMEVSSITDNVTNLFMKEYFQNVGFTYSENKDSFLLLDIQVTDYKYRFGSLDNVNMQISMKVNVYKSGMPILSKKYDNEDVSNDNILSFKFGDVTLHGQAVETFHKGVLKILETKVKPDLLKALKENI